MLTLTKQVMRRMMVVSICVMLTGTVHAEEVEAVRFDPVEQEIEGWTVHVDPHANLIRANVQAIIDPYFPGGRPRQGR